MTNRTNPMRRHSRFPVSWPVVYGNDAILAEGTVLDLTSRGWRVVGSISMIPGMQLTLQVSVPERSAPLCIHRATVLWVKDHEFAIEAQEMAPIDQAWVTEFLRHKLGLMWMSRTADLETSLNARDEASHGEAILPQPCIPSLEDILHRLYAIDTVSTDMPVEARWNSDSRFHESEVHTSYNHVPEKIWHEARRILYGMVAMHATRDRTGRDPITNN